MGKKKKRKSLDELYQKHRDEGHWPATSAFLTLWDDYNYSIKSDETEHFSRVLGQSIGLVYIAPSAGIEYTCKKIYDKIR